jgi:hypothetical protein
MYYTLVRKLSKNIRLLTLQKRAASMVISNGGCEAFRRPPGDSQSPPQSPQSPGDLPEKNAFCRWKSRKCGTCGKCCVIIPVPGGAPEHKELSYANIQLWAQLAASIFWPIQRIFSDILVQAKGASGVTLTSPPQQLALQLSDNLPQRRNKPKPAGNPVANPANPETGPPAAQAGLYVPPLAMPAPFPHPATGIYYPPIIPLATLQLL